jgi:hypothetical protein
VDQGVDDELRRGRSWLGVAGLVVLLATVGLAAGFASQFGPRVIGEVTDAGRPLAGATCYAMPGPSEYATTGVDGRFELHFAALDHADTVDICVVAPDGRRTDFGEVVVRPGWFGVTTVAIDFAGRSPWPGLR